MRISGLVVFAVLAVALAAPQPEASARAKGQSIAASHPHSLPPTRWKRTPPSSKPLKLSQYVEKAKRSRRSGSNVGPPQELYTPPGNTRGERPVIQGMANMFQLGQTDADLFSPTGRSMLCGAASMTNALLFLRVNRKPPISDIAKTSIAPGESNDVLLRTVFDRCQVSRKKGSTDRQLLECASDFLAEGGYDRQGAWLRSMWSEVGSSDRSAPQLSDLRETVRLNRVAVLLFGWYTANQNPATKVWSYVRTGGHFVTLAGYDRTDQRRIYISNPLIDYAALGAAPVSALVMEPVGADIVFARLDNAPSDDLNTAVGQRWQTRDLTARRIAVLESMMVVGPLPRSDAEAAPRQSE